MGLFLFGAQGMAAELKDFRGKVTVETDCVLEALNRVTGRDKSEIAREVLHEWAMERVHMNNVLGRLLKAEGVLAASEGLPAASQGIPGNSRESQGTSGNRREAEGVSGNRRDSQGA